MASETSRAVIERLRGALVDYERADDARVQGEEPPDGSWVVEAAHEVMSEYDRCGQSLVDRAEVLVRRGEDTVSRCRELDIAPPANTLAFTELSELVRDLARAVAER